MRHTRRNQDPWLRERDSYDRFTGENDYQRRNYNDYYEEDVAERGLYQDEFDTDEEGYYNDYESGRNENGRREYERGENSRHPGYRNYGDRESGYYRDERGRGFASMHPDEVREIASRGGRASHSNRPSFLHRNYDYGRAEYRGERNEEGRKYRDASYSYRNQGSQHDSRYERGRNGNGRGFASMDRDEVREAARRGGRNSHSGSYTGANSRRSGSHSRGSHSQRRGRPSSRRKVTR